MVQAAYNPTNQSNITFCGMTTCAAKYKNKWNRQTHNN